jgi:hypothetical protein
VSRVDEGSDFSSLCIVSHLHGEVWGDTSFSFLSLLDDDLDKICYSNVTFISLQMLLSLRLCRYLLSGSLLTN